MLRIIIFLIVFLKNINFIQSLWCDVTLNLNESENMGSTIRDLESEAHLYRPNIFFVQTKCFSYDNGVLTLSNREVCAIESVARLHKFYNIYVLFLYKVHQRQFSKDLNDQLIYTVKKYKNIRFRYLNIKQVVTSLKLKLLYEQIQASPYAEEHLQDLIKLYLLWKYGGLYLDLDVIITRNFTLYEDNYVGIENKENIGSAIINLRANKIGYAIARFCFETFITHYNIKAKKQVSAVFLNLYNRLCPDRKTDQDFENKSHICHGFTFHRSHLFYLINSTNWNILYENYTEIFDEKLKDVGLVYFWDEKSRDKKIKSKSNQTLAVLAKKFCPKVFALSETF